MDDKDNCSKERAGDVKSGNIDGQREICMMQITAQHMDTERE